MTQERGVNNPYTEAEITESLMRLIAWAGNCKKAHDSLKAEGKAAPHPNTLANWMNETHAARYDELREKYQEQLEARMIHEFRDVARAAVEVQRLGLEKAQHMLLSNDDRDPSRTAANAARVAQSMTDKMLSLSGRPTSIREDRNAEEIIRSLAAKGIIQIPETAVVVEPPAALGGA